MHPISPPKRLCMFWDLERGSLWLLGLFRLPSLGPRKQVERKSGSSPMYFVRPWRLALGAEDYLQRDLKLRASAASSLALLPWGLESSGLHSEWSSEWHHPWGILWGDVGGWLLENQEFSKERGSVHCCGEFHLRLRNLSCSVHSYPELEGNGNLGWINRDAVSRIKEVRIPLPQRQLLDRTWSIVMNSEKHIFQGIWTRWNIFIGEWKSPLWSVGMAGNTVIFNLEKAKLRLWLGFKCLEGCAGDPCVVPEVLTLESQNSWVEALRRVILFNMRKNEFHLEWYFYCFLLDHQSDVLILEHLRGENKKKFMKYL